MAGLAQVMGPPANKGHVSVVRLEHQWFIAANSGDLGKTPLACCIQGVPLVLFRDARGTPGALLDRCPHRNIPLSIGKVTGAGRLQCAYHGWEFDGGGVCRAVPGLCDNPEAPARNAPHFPTREQDGFVWVYTTPDVTPQCDPFPMPPAVHDGAYTVVRKDLRMNASMQQSIENALDVPHTGFLHGGLFRTSDKRNDITVAIHRKKDRVEAEYLGEPRPTGLVGRVLAPGGGTVTHFDRFIMPCVAQVEYRLADHSHVLVTTMFTPIGDFETHMYAVVAIKLPIPGRVLKPVLMPLALRIFAQDAHILDLQTRLIQKFGGEQFVHTEIDVLGPHIWHMLRQAERGLPAEDHAEPLTRRMRT